MNFNMAIDNNAGPEQQLPVDLSSDQNTIKLESRNKPMKRIPVDWLFGEPSVADNIAIHVLTSESPIHSILQRGIPDSHSLNQIQKLNMEHLTQWEKFPVRILRSL
jgi:hypothetical protein